MYNEQKLTNRDGRRYKTVVDDDIYIVVTIKRIYAELMCTSDFKNADWRFLSTLRHIIYGRVSRPIWYHNIIIIFTMIIAFGDFFPRQECITRAATLSRCSNNISESPRWLAAAWYHSTNISNVSWTAHVHVPTICVCVCVCASVCTPFNRWTGGPITRWPGPVEFECSRLENKPRFYSKRATPPWREKYMYLYIIIK